LGSPEHFERTRRKLKNSFGSRCEIVDSEASNSLDSEKKLIVEIDGGIHKQQVEYDKIREGILREMGFRIIRFTNEEVLKDWSKAEEKLADALAELSPDPSLKKRGERIPQEFRGEFKIVILGPESTGKTTLAKQLAEHFNTEWVPEYARQYIDELDRPYEESDLLKIAKGQLQLEDEIASKSNGFLFCDTNLTTIKIWSDYKYGRTDSWILKSLNTRKYDFYLLTNIDLPWESDPQREHPNERQELFDLYKDYLESNQLRSSVITGQGNLRLQNAIKPIESLRSSI